MKSPSDEIFARGFAKAGGKDYFLPMPVFVHVTAERFISKIRRGGLLLGEVREPIAKGVFALPVTPNFQVSHQWMRETKKWKRGQMVGVYFRLLDEELVWVGRYGQEHAQVTAAEASARVRAEQEMTGIEVIIPRRIRAKEFLRISRLPKVVGWRHYPAAHGKLPPTCACCQRGEFGSRKIRVRYGTDNDPR